MVGLTELAERKPRALSGGQQQRVALARVLVTKPKALLLDEPLGDLDRLLQLRMRVELRNLQRQLGLMFIHVTHNQEEALSMADRIVVMNDARIQQVADPSRSRRAGDRARRALHGRQQHHPRQGGRARRRPGRGRGRARRPRDFRPGDKPQSATIAQVSVRAVAVQIGRTARGGRRSTRRNARSSSSSSSAISSSSTSPPAAAPGREGPRQAIPLVSGREGRTSGSPGRRGMSS